MIPTIHQFIPTLIPEYYSIRNDSIFAADIGSEYHIEKPYYLDKIQIFNCFNLIKFRLQP